MYGALSIVELELVGHGRAQECHRVNHQREQPALSLLDAQRRQAHAEAARLRPPRTRLPSVHQARQWQRLLRHRAQLDVRQQRQNAQQRRPRHEPDAARQLSRIDQCRATSRLKAGARRRRFRRSTHDQISKGVSLYTAAFLVFFFFKKL